MPGSPPLTARAEKVSAVEGGRGRGKGAGRARGSGGAVRIEEARGRTAHSGFTQSQGMHLRGGVPPHPAPAFSYESKSACAFGTRDGCTRVGEGADRWEWGTVT